MPKLCIPLLTVGRGLAPADALATQVHTEYLISTLILPSKWGMI